MTEGTEPKQISIPNFIEMPAEQRMQRANDNRIMEGEEALWVNTITKGIFTKTVAEKWFITNMRICKICVATKERPKEEFCGFPIIDVDVVVMNQHRKSNGTRVGTFAGGTGRGFAGAGAGVSSSTSTSYGDLVFLSGGKEVLRFRGISDPNGVKKMVETVKKQTKQLVKEAAKADKKEREGA